MLQGDKICGTPLDYDYAILELLPPFLGDQCRLVRRLTEPSSRLYIRVNTFKITPEKYLDALNGQGYSFYQDEEVSEALWTKVEGPLPFKRYEKIVIADKRAAESVLMGSDLYVPGVLKARNVSVGDHVTIVAPNNIPVGSGIALKNERDLPILKKLSREGRKTGVFVKVTEPMYRSVRVSELPGYSEGLSYGQGLPSMYVARLLDPEPGDKIIDLTAAPGGKVSHIAQLAGPHGKIVAVDRPSKLARLKETLNRLGVKWIKIIGHDARYLHIDFPSLAGAFDKAVVDPPCTNLGVIPKVMEKKTIVDVGNLARYQFQLIKASRELLRRGGTLIYSVCTLTTPETVSQVSRILDLGFEPVDVPGWVKKPIVYGNMVWFSPLIHGVPGFFIALLRKK